HRHLPAPPGDQRLRALPVHHERPRATREPLRMGRPGADGQPHISTTPGILIARTLGPASNHRASTHSEYPCPRSGSSQAHPAASAAASWRPHSSAATRSWPPRARPSPLPSIHNTEPITMDDVIIIGGSFAGLAGALQLGRARRKVTVLDTGLPRNRFAGHSHGLLGHDHKPPLDILAEARQQLARYPTIKLVSARAESVSGAIDGFNVLTSDGESLGARRLILSYGVADQMPDVPVFAESWGTSIVPCPYCDG